MMLHSNWLNRLKITIGASHVSYERYKDIYHLKVIKNKEHKYFPLTGTPQDVTPERYVELAKKLIEYYEQV